MRKVLNSVNFATLKDNDHIAIFEGEGTKPIFIGKLTKKELSKSTSNNAIVAILTHPDGTTYGLTAHSIWQHLYDYEKGKILVMNDSFLI